MKRGPPAERVWREGTVGEKAPQRFVGMVCGGDACARQQTADCVCVWNARMPFFWVGEGRERAAVARLQRKHRAASSTGAGSTSAAHKLHPHQHWHRGARARVVVYPVACLPLGGGVSCSRTPLTHGSSPHVSIFSSRRLGMGLRPVNQTRLRCARKVCSSCQAVMAQPTVMAVPAPAAAAGAAAEAGPAVGPSAAAQGAKEGATAPLHVSSASSLCSPLLFFSRRRSHPLQGRSCGEGASLRACDERQVHWQIAEIRDRDGPGLLRCCV